MYCERRRLALFFYITGFLLVSSYAPGMQYIQGIWRRFATVFMPCRLEQFCISNLSPTIRFYIFIWSSVWSRFQSTDLHRKFRPNFENTPSRVKIVMVGDSEVFSASNRSESHLPEAEKVTKFRTEQPQGAQLTVASQLLPTQHFAHHDTCNAGVGQRGIEYTVMFS